jgi:hypothetical protein
VEYGVKDEKLDEKEALSLYGLTAACLISLRSVCSLSALLVATGKVYCTSFRIVLQRKSILSSLVDSDLLFGDEERAWRGDGLSDADDAMRVLGNSEVAEE